MVHKSGRTFSGVNGSNDGAISHHDGKRFCDSCILAWLDADGDDGASVGWSTGESCVDCGAAETAGMFTLPDGSAYCGDCMADHLGELS